MIRTTNIYSNREALSLAMKVQRLNILGVKYDINIVDGIGSGEKVVSLTWDETEYEKALNEEEEF